MDFLQGSLGVKQKRDIVSQIVAVMRFVKILPAVHIVFLIVDVIVIAVIAMIVMIVVIVMIEGVITIDRNVGDTV